MNKSIIQIILIILPFLIAVLPSCNHTPETPVCVYPPDQSTGISDSVIELEWMAKDRDNDKLTFDLYLSIDSQSGILDFNRVTLLAQGYEGYTYTVENLKDTTDYIWGIEVYDEKGRHTLGMFSFSTGIIPSK
jgi:hypothetical protein